MQVEQCSADLSVEAPPIHADRETSSGSHVDAPPPRSEQGRAASGTVCAASAARRSSSPATWLRSDCGPSRCATRMRLCAASSTARLETYGRFCSATAAARTRSRPGAARARGESPVPGIVRSLPTQASLKLGGWPRPAVAIQHAEGRQVRGDVLETDEDLGKQTNDEMILSGAARPSDHAAARSTASSSKRLAVRASSRSRATSA